MRIAIPVDENNIDSKVCISFGRTPYFLIYDSETDSEKYIDNSAAASAGGAGLKAAQIIVDEEVDVVLTIRCGENAANILAEGNIKLFKTKSELANENIKDYLNDKLEVLEEIHAGFHMHP